MVIGRRKAPRQKRRHEEVLPGAVPGGGEELEPYREDDDEHDAEPEERHGLARHGDHRAEGVHERVAAERGEDAQGDGDEQSHSEACEGEVDGGGHALDHESEGGGVGVPGAAEVALHGPACELPVLDVERPVEAQQLTVALELLLARVLGRRSGTGSPMTWRMREGQHGDTDDDHGQLDDLTGDIVASATGRRRLTPGRPAPSWVRAGGRKRRHWAPDGKPGLLLPRGHEEEPVDLVGGGL